jgi:hypothetical protein
MSNLALFFAALYVSEAWWLQWYDYPILKRAGLSTRPTWPIYCRARAVVLYDRIITGRANIQVLQERVYECHKFITRSS